MWTTGEELNERHTESLSETLQPHLWTKLSVATVHDYLPTKVKTVVRVWCPDSLVSIADKQVSFICSIMLKNL